MIAAGADHGLAAISIVVVPQEGTQVIVPIDVTSTRQTALIAVSCLPSGLQEKYAASGHNPSGSLVFTVSTATPAGTSTPAVTVNPAGQTASTNFTWVVTVGTKTGDTNRFDARCEGHALVVHARVHFLTGRHLPDAG
jgi:hypothetical protein